MKPKKALIIGAGPAGLTAAYELLQKTKIKPVIIEAENTVGGISRTVKYKGNRMDIGGHRFFSKSPRIMQWWFDKLPLQGAPARDDIILNRKVPLSGQPGAGNPEEQDLVTLVRNRLSRIYFLGKFFAYPVALNFNTIFNLGFIRTFKIGCSYIWHQLFPVKPETSLEDFFTNRFGKQLYLTFFKDYTEKVWGVSCRHITADWGRQRIKGLSIGKTIVHFFKKKITFRKNKKIKTETSLIEQFYYPKYGPGQMWQTVADRITAHGGELYLDHEAVKININHNHIESLEVKYNSGKNTKIIKADYFISSMPVKDLILSITPAAPSLVCRTAAGLVYRDFITVGLLLNKLKIKNRTKIKTINNIIPDTWIYIQEKNVKLGRLQIFNNWSPYLVKDPDTVWIGLEYFCTEGDSFWQKSDREIIRIAAAELEKTGIIAQTDIIDKTIIRVKKTYPAYFGTYSDFHIIKKYVDKIKNLFLTGRNGMHRYNNMDHSMLTAMAAVDNIKQNRVSKDNIWSINTEKEYHESRQNP
ncbi:MAG TPA: NAD(P)/FAD-dependent oxidoreductase [Spirochaetota bacterium]|nr:NAD(P)/FAD-dependent oxidoreductase [Spirochaetota bacterium]